jgi:hypothetical protein
MPANGEPKNQEQEPQALSAAERLVLTSHYAGEVSGGWAAHTLGLSGKAEFMDWLRERGLGYITHASDEEAEMLIEELRKEGLSTQESVELLDRITYKVPEELRADDADQA